MTKILAILAVMALASAAHAQARPIPVAPPPVRIIIVPPPPPPPPPPPRIVLPPPPPRIDWDQRRIQPAPRIQPVPVAPQGVRR
jgi:periplasmic protein TonB